MSSYRTSFTHREEPVMTKCKFCGTMHEAHGGTPFVTCEKCGGQTETVPQAVRDELCANGGQGDAAASAMDLTSFRFERGVKIGLGLLLVGVGMFMTARSEAITSWLLPAPQGGQLASAASGEVMSIFQSTTRFFGAALTFVGLYSAFLGFTEY